MTNSNSTVVGSNIVDVTKDQFKNVVGSAMPSDSRLSTLGVTSYGIETIGSTSTTSSVPLTATSITGDSSSNATYANLNFVPSPNQLNNFDQATYHIKFSIVSDIAGVQNEVVIAETGATELNIQNFVMDSYVGPDMMTKNTSMTKMEMEVLEFYGFSLMDRIIEASVSLNISNFQKTPFKIEIKFVGRNASTGEAIDNLLPGQVWGWKVLLSKINTKVTDAGCIHHLSFYPMSDLAGTDDYMRIPESYSASGKTCGDILNDLLGKLTADINAKYGGIQMIKYRVGAVPYPSSAQSSVANPLLHVVTNQNIIDTSRNPNNASMSTGIAINELVDNLLSNSETAVTLASGTSTGSAVPASEPTKVHSTMCRIEKVVEYGSYIDLYNDYEKIITYILVPYDTIRIVNNFDQYLNINDPTRTAARIQQMNSNGFMKKEYDYIFTGENTEIINFDIDLSFDYYTSVEIMLGVMSYSAKTQGQAFNEIAKIRTDAMAYQQYQTELQDLMNQKVQSKEITAQEGVLTGKIAALQNEVQAAALASETRGKQKQTQSILDMQNKSKTSYADDENYSTAINDLQNMPLTIRQTPGIMSSLDGVVESNYDTRRAVYAALLDQLYGNLDSNLASIKMDIKGDPFWLGRPGYRNLFSDGFSVIGSDITVMGYTIPGSDPSDDFANYTIGENVFILRYKVPQGFDDTTGAPNIKENNVYTGFYSVSQVTHKFINGAFTQTVQGYRIPAAAVSKVIKSNTVGSSSTSVSATGNSNPPSSTTTSKMSTTNGTI